MDSGYTFMDSGYTFMEEKGWPTPMFEATKNGAFFFFVKPWKVKKEFVHIFELHMLEKPLEYSQLSIS